MSAPQTCANCLFYSEGTSKGFPNIDGMCRRYAPQGMASTAGGCWQVFPPMNRDQWCGDYRPDPAHEASAAKPTDTRTGVAA